MSDLISDCIFRLAASNITMMAWTVGALLLLGAVLGALKKFALSLFTSRRPGNPGPRLTAKPAAKLLSILALTGVAGYAGARFIPVTTADAEIPAANLDDELERLHSQLDQLHGSGVAREAKTIDLPATRRVFVGRSNDFLAQPIYRRVPNKRADYRRYRSYAAHKKLTFSPVPTLTPVTVIYHHRCAACDQNFRIRLKIDAIYERQANALRQNQPFTPTDTMKGQRP
jgi:hypothetical protein